MGKSLSALSTLRTYVRNVDTSRCVAFVRRTSVRTTYVSVQRTRVSASAGSPAHADTTIGSVLSKRHADVVIRAPMLVPLWDEPTTSPLAARDQSPCSSRRRRASLAARSGEARRSRTARRRRWRALSRAADVSEGRSCCRAAA